MSQRIDFEELGITERTLLLRAFDFDVDDKGFILDERGSRVPSSEIPSTFLKVDAAFLAPGSLEILDGTPTSISKFIRERVESAESSS